VSVVYDQLKRVEQTQAEVPPAIEAEESLPLEEEIQHQQQEKWYRVKGSLLKGGSILLVLLGSMALFAFISSRKSPLPEETKPYILLPPEQTAAKPSVATPAAKQFPKEVFKPILAAKKEEVAKSRGSEPSVPAVDVGITVPKTERIKPPRVTPAMLAKSKKPLSPIQAGQQFYQTGALEQAVQAYEKALQEEPKQLEAYNNLGVVYTRQSRLKAAAKSFKQALAANPYYAEAHYNLAVLLEKKGDNRRALGHYLKFIEYAQSEHKQRVKQVEGHLDVD